MEIPALLPPDQMPPIVDQASLEHHWRALMGELGFGARKLWLLLIEASRALQIIEIDELPRTLDDGMQESLQSMLAHFPDVSVALLYTRPGPSWSDADRTWVRGLAAVSADWPVHMANDVELRVVAPDDLV
jgi:hypothetical protein